MADRPDPIFPGSIVKAWTLVLTPLFMSGCLCQGSETGTGEQFEIALQTDLLPSPPGEPLLDLGNIFFVEPDSKELASGLQIPGAWRKVEVASVVSMEGENTVYALRHVDAHGVTRYVVDADRDLDFTDEQELVFEYDGRRKLATVDIAAWADPVGDRTPADVTYQIVWVEQEDGPTWTYSRILEYRTGVLQIDGQQYAVMLRPRSRSDVHVPYPACELPGTARVPSSHWLDTSSTKGDTWDRGKHIPIQT